MTRVDLFSGVVPFVTVAQEQSFRAAAERLGVTPAAISKSVARLEEDLGVRLLARTTRSVALTPAGTELLERFRGAVDLVERGREEAVKVRAAPGGTVVLTLSVVLSRFVVPRFAVLGERYPALALRFRVSDRYLNLVEEGIDVAIRIGELTDSSLGARRLHTPRWVMLASPGYLARHGVPTDPGALSRHNCLRYATASGAPHPWTVAIGAQEAPVRVEVEGNLVVDDGQAILEAAVAGMGICQVLDFMGTEHIRAGRLVEVLAPHTAPGPPVHALFASRRNREANVRVCLDFLAELFAELGGSAQKA